MKKMNVMRSSEFHMDQGDILHLLFEGESGVAITYTLNSTDPVTGDDNIEDPPSTPVALPASDITSNSFTTNWNFMENTLGFYLDVAKDSAFTTFVAGYNNLDVGLVNEFSVVGLDDTISYYYRVRGYNDYGTSVLYSNIITLTTEAESVQDFDGNIYTYVTIGTQQWLVENLRTTHYNNGADITNVVGNAAWAALGTEAYCWYNNDLANAPIYGALYNYYAVSDARGIAPIGWRIPTIADFNTLIAFTGGGTVAGGKLKEVGLVHWLTPNTGAIDSYGFKFLPGGRRGWFSGTFEVIYEKGNVWSSNIVLPNSLLMSYNSITFTTSAIEDYESGLSVRCMRDV